MHIKTRLSRLRFVGHTEWKEQAKEFQINLNVDHYSQLNINFRAAKILIRELMFEQLKTPVDFIFQAGVFSSPLDPEQSSWQHRQFENKFSPRTSRQEG